VISDFGLAHSPGSSSSGGSVGYLSPERLIESPLSFADDVYALGRILEDVVQALADAPPRWRSLAQSLTADRSVRPPDAAAVLAKLEG
jgi:serine/threonine-protein kinase